MELAENLFRNRLTYRAFNDVKGEFERFKWHAARDYNDAVTAAKVDLAILLLTDIGRSDMAETLQVQLQDTLNRAQSAIAPRRKSRRKMEPVETTPKKFASRVRAHRLHAVAK